LDVSQKQIVVRVVYKAYRFVRKNFSYSFQVIDTEGVRMKRLNRKKKVLNKEWKEISFEVNNPGKPINFVLIAEVNKKSSGSADRKMFWLNIGQVSLYPKEKQISRNEIDIFEFLTVARKSLLPASILDNREVIDLHIQSIQKSHQFQPLQYVLSKPNGQFVYNVYFRSLTVKNLIFKPDKSGCESFEVDVLTEEGHLMKSTSGIQVCQQSLLPLEFSTALI